MTRRTIHAVKLGENVFLSFGYGNVSITDISCFNMLREFFRRDMDINQTNVPDSYQYNSRIFCIFFNTRTLQIKTDLHKTHPNDEQQVMMDTIKCVNDVLYIMNIGILVTYYPETKKIGLLPINKSNKEHKPVDNTRRKIIQNNSYKSIYIEYY